MLLAALAAVAPGAAAQDLGYEGPGFHGAGTAPTESKPESKLWFHDGAWWGCLWSTSAQAFHIHRLDQRTHVWTDTGTAIDFRATAKCDALADGERLYVASHRGSSDGGVSGHPILLLRYAYDTLNDAYSLDAGFPVTIGSFSTESLVIDKDSTGTVWAAWVQGRRVHYGHSVGGNDLVWSAPAILPGSDSDFTIDEVCALTRFGGNKIGVMWSDQALNLFRFAVHEDGAPDDAWSLETPLAGQSDDHIHLAADSAGRVFATVKNAAEEIKLLVRDAGGAWSVYPVSAGIDRFTRPIVLLDEEQRRIHVFASGQDNGLIHEKTSSLDAIAFAPGTGRVVLRDASDPLVNNATSTKQGVDGTTGLVVLAAHETSEMYWHHSVAPAGLLVASFTAAPVSGVAPLAVQFTDTSTGTPTSWSWDFGDGGASSAQNPAHVYTQGGTFAVRLTVQNAGGSDDELWNGLVTVAPEHPTQTFLPVADSRVNEAAPGSNAGKNAELRIRSSPGGSYETYLRFDLSALSGPVASAKLRLFCTDGSTVGGLVFPTANGWSETTLTWNNKPAATGGQITALGSITSNTWVEYDVTPGIAGPGLVSFLLRTTSTNSAYFTSRESTSPPELVVSLTEIVPTVAEFTASTTSGTAPLSVAFTDLSSGNPTGWSWDFGDGTGSTLRNPVHVYASAGSYTVALTASGPGGTSTESKFELVFVTPPAAPVASFTGTPTSGSAPLPVAFTDTSSGGVSTWSWDFGDGSGSSLRNPSHVYAAPGLYTVTLVVTGPGGTDDETLTDLVAVSAPPPIHTLLPVADARVNEASPASNAGAANVLRVRFASGGSYQSYLRYDLSSLSGTVVSAKLRIFCTDASNVGGQVFPTTSTWGESTIHWNNKPAATGPQAAAFGAVATNAWAEVDVTSAVTGTGLVSFLLTSNSNNSATYSSREGTNPPELVVQTGVFQPPVADFSGSPTAGVAPLAVSFSDQSTSGPASWSWSFGDGATSSARNPLHLYSTAGTYTVTLTATNALGSSVAVRSGYVTVTAPPPVQVLLPVADARVNEASPTTNSGRATELRTRAATGGSFHSYLRFDLSGLGVPATSAKLRLYCTDGSNVGGFVFPTSSSWAENTIHWSNKPAASGAQIAALGPVVNGAWVEVDVSAALGAPGPLSLLLTTTSSDSALFSSREGTHPPELVVRTGSGRHDRDPLSR